jgi:hypothetical protein
MLMKPLLVLMLAISGCAVTSNRQWAKPGSTAQDLAKADFACQKQALEMTKAYGAGPANKGWVLANYHESCMRADGWEEKQ